MFRSRALAARHSSALVGLCARAWARGQRGHALDQPRQVRVLVAGEAVGALVELGVGELPAAVGIHQQFPIAQMSGQK